MCGGIHFLLHSLSFSLLSFRGIDPIMFAALCGVGSGVVGYLIGGATFTATWKLIAKSKFKELQQVGTGWGWGRAIVVQWNLR